VKIFFLEIGHIGYKKIDNFMLILKCKLTLVTKCPQKKLKLKNDKKWDLANLENSFLILTFLGGILSLRQVCFFEISIKFSIF
jgi:hypothetical protein